MSTNRKYYSCSAGEDGKDYDEENLGRIRERCSFVLHEDTQRKGAYEEVTAGDMLLLKFKGKFVAYGEAIGRNDITDEGGWSLCIEVKQWHFHDADDPKQGVSIRGLKDASYGGPYDTIKHIEADFGQSKVCEIGSCSQVHRQISEEGYMKQLLDLLQANHQVILTGAPGTGKTYLARKMAAAMLECSSTDLMQATRGQFGFVQFHPSYDYSDFVEGLKPTLVEGQITFELRDGVFKAFCNAAAKSPDRKYVFIIDEINRADLSRVFGELFFAIESSYRGDRVTTQYSYLRQDGTFTVPPNVFIIGTMNDIDRSVESLDFALRRRFAWREIEADDACFTRVADNLAERTGGARERYNALNKIIADLPSLGRSYMVGPAYFRQLSLYPNDNNCFELLWNNHIESLLKEYLRGMNDSAAAHRAMKDAYDLKTQEIKQ